MKKHFATLALALAMCAVQRTYAQTEKGTFTIGTNVAAGIWKPESGILRPETYDMNSLRVIPSAGFFIRNNTLISIGVPIESGEARYNYTSAGAVSRTASSSVGLSLTARRYFLEGRLKPFVQLDGGYTWNSVQLYRIPQDQPSETRKGETIRASAGLGVSYFISNRFSVEATASLGVSNVKGAFNEKKLDPSNRFLLLGIGVNWYLPGKAKR
ncbi:MAG: autotransporter outer membrane beta-barrel domain-containing protein [Cytophagaceae bacterium]|nr:MAG: autotransporter outer membrane beta-barrel domain-containing protein [Cytophagaceae bacterium]